MNFLIGISYRRDMKVDSFYKHYEYSSIDEAIKATENFNEEMKVLLKRHPSILLHFFSYLKGSHTQFGYSVEVTDPMIIFDRTSLLGDDQQVRAALLKKFKKSNIHHRLIIIDHVASQIFAPLLRAPRANFWDFCQKYQFSYRYLENGSQGVQKGVERLVSQHFPAALCCQIM